MQNLNRLDRRIATAVSFMGVFLALTPVANAQDEQTQSDSAVFKSTAVPSHLLPGLIAAQTASTSAATQPVEAAAVAPPVAAEAPPPANDEAESGVEDVIVTGTRIRRKDLTTSTPLTILDSQTITNSGLVSVGDILQNLPQQGNAINVQFNNGGSGATRVNLRGLGPQRTLVLLNGRRVVPGGFGANASVDLNIIPVDVIDRIEVLRDGASAVYGSDAIGGVVNIITKDDFTGVQANAFYGGSQHGGPQFQASISAGDISERSSFFFNAQYFRQEALFAGQREFAESSLDVDFPTGDETTTGSSAPPEGNIFGADGTDAGNATWDGLTGRFPDGALWHNSPTDGWRPFRDTGNSDVGEGDFYNFQPENYLVTPSERFSLFATGEYQIVEDRLKFYAEALYQNRQSDRLLAPEPLFLGFIGEGITVSGDNAYNPFGVDFTDVRRRMVEGGNRRFIASSHVYRVVTGLEFEFPENLGKLSTWSADFNFNYGRTESAEISEGLYIASRLANAVGPSFFDENLVAQCGTPDAPIGGGCVPLNIFGGAGTITQDMLDYLTFTGIQRGFSEQRIFSFEVGGEVFDLWDRPVGLVFGIQHRLERGGNIPSTIEAIGDSTGNNALPTGGQYEEIAGYVETNIPLLADLPGVELFEVNAALRVFNFDSFGTDFMAKVGGLWKVSDDLSIRGNWSRAFRAPSVSDLFEGAQDSFPNVTDPCETDAAGLGRSPAAVENCRRDGLPDVLQTGQTQIRTLVGGNPNLDPETADVFTAGIVLTPTFFKPLKGLSITLDYFNINIENAIQTVSADIILNNCYNSSSTESERENCDQIFRNDQNLIVQIDDRNTNIGGFDTSGLDISLRYTKGSPLGRFTFTFDGVWVDEFSSTLPDGNRVSGLDVYDLSNTDIDGFMPSWRYTSSLQWAYKGYSLGSNLRYTRGIRECDDNDCDSDSSADNPLNRGVNPNVNVDIYGSVTFSNPLGFTSLRAGINNISDQTPPVIYAGFLANSDAANYDYLGRFFYVSLLHRL